jgi:quercetin dioxygenase-like cupin family protein
MSSKFEPSQPFSPVKCIGYADNAVVSKIILKKPTGNITLFAFDKGESLAEHSSPHDVLIEILEGEAEITIGGTSHSLRAHQSIILPENIPHALHATSRFKMMLTMIKS